MLHTEVREDFLFVLWCEDVVSEEEKASRSVFEFLGIDLRQGSAVILHSFCCHCIYSVLVLV